MAAPNIASVTGIIGKTSAVALTTSPQAVANNPVSSGKVLKVKEDGEIEVEIAEGVRVRVVKQTISAVVSKTEPVKE